MKKTFACLLTFMMVVSMVKSKPVEAVNFNGQESKYMKICSSHNLSTSNYNTCKEFNAYLKKKNKYLHNLWYQQKNVPLHLILYHAYQNF